MSFINLYTLPNIIRIIISRIGWAGHVTYMGTKRNAYMALVGNPEGNRPLGRPILENNIKMNL
jgi:hypothetical protein